MILDVGLGCSVFVKLIHGSCVAWVLERAELRWTGLEVFGSRVDSGRSFHMIRESPP